MQGLQKTASTIAPTLLCSTSGVPPTEVSWQKNGYSMAMGGNDTEMIKSITNRYSSSYSTSLLLHTDIENIKGSYTCMAGNRYDTRTSQSFNIKGIMIVMLNMINLVQGHISLSLLCTFNRN